MEYLSSFVSKDTIHCGVSTRGLAKYVRSHACSVSLTIICLNNLCIDESLSAFFLLVVSDKMKSSARHRPQADCNMEPLNDEEDKDCSNCDIGLV